MALCFIHRSQRWKDDLFSEVAKLLAFSAGPELSLVGLALCDAHAAAVEPHPAEVTLYELVGEALDHGTGANFKCVSVVMAHETHLPASHREVDLRVKLVATFVERLTVLCILDEGTS